LTAGTKVLTGQFAARRDGVACPGQLRAGTALIARGEFSLVIIGLVGAAFEDVGAVATPYVFVLAMVGPVLARFTDAGGKPVPTR
jgi:monovalent cation:H+ antiporter-2, CPA2 family